MTIIIHTTESYELLLADAQDELGGILETLQAPDLLHEWSTDEIIEMQDRRQELEGKITGLRERLGALDRQFVPKHEETLIRLHQANDLLRCIARYGRKFFFHKGRVSRFEIDTQNKVRFRDAHSWVDILMQGQWSNRHFSEGGTLRALVRDLAEYIRSGTQLEGYIFGPWPSTWCNGDLWGYGEDMKYVRATAWSLGIVAELEIAEEDE